MHDNIHGGSGQKKSKPSLESFLDSVIENIPDMIFIKDAKDLRFVRFNQAGERLLGYSRDELIGKNDYDFFPKDEADFFTQKDRNVLNSGKLLEIKEEPIHTRNKKIRYLHTKKIPIYDDHGKPRYLLGISEDITLKKKQEVEMMHFYQRLEQKVQERTQELSKLVGTDPLTNILNRRGLEVALGKITSQKKVYGEASYAVLVDLDNFKLVNKSFGYVIGDSALKRVAAVVTSLLRPSDYFGRIGGDEFVILLPNITEEDALSVAERIRVGISNIIVGMTSGKTMNLSVSQGMVLINRHSHSFEELIERSYYALDQSKDGGKNTVAYRDKLGISRNEISQILSSMVGESTKANKFFAARQCIRSLSSQEIVGYELLTRLDHESGVLPLDFFRIAMDAQILMLTDILCLRTCLEYANSTFGKKTRIHINLFPSTLIEVPTQTLLSEFSQVNSNMSICIEISEQQIIGDPSPLVDAIQRIKAVGIEIALDDIGFGSSCLESLLLLEPDIIKIDKSCVTRAHKSKTKIGVLKKLLRIIHTCNSKAYAEGIESQSDLELLKDLGVQTGQGFFFSRPLP